MVLQNCLKELINLKMGIQEILFIIAAVIIILIPIIRVVNNIRNGRKWYQGMYASGE